MQQETAEETPPDRADFSAAVERRIVAMIYGLNDLVHGFDFTRLSDALLSCLPRR